MSGEVIPLRRHDLHQGDCVRLKSGGPLMLVGISDAEIMSQVMCLWMVRRRLASGLFEAVTLELVARGDR